MDPLRIGAAGCSGGGALTTFIGALDSRLKAVIPACFPNSFRSVVHGADPHSEMTLPGHLAIGLDTADFVDVVRSYAVADPGDRTGLLHAAGGQNDVRGSQALVRALWRRGQVEFFVGPGPHGTPRVSREAVYKWLIRWLNNGQGDFHDAPVRQYSNHELLVTRTGRVEDEPGSRKVYQLILDSLQARKSLARRAELPAELRSLGIPTDGSAPRVKALEAASREGFQDRHIQFESEPGIEIDASLYLPRSSGTTTGGIICAR